MKKCIIGVVCLCAGLVQSQEEALAWTLSFDGASNYAQGKIDWQNGYKFAFGQTKLGSQGIRKTDDKIDLQPTLTYKMGTFVDPFVGALREIITRDFNIHLVVWSSCRPWSTKWSRTRIATDWREDVPGEAVHLQGV